MKRIAKILVLMTVALAVANSAAAKGREIFNADPTIYVEGGKYYLTGTRNDNPPGFSLLESKDLKNWRTADGDSLQMILTCGDSTFGDKNGKGFWAPQLFKDGDRYYLSYTVNEQTTLASSESLHGPFRQDEVRPIDYSERNIDSFLFKDSDGKYYLYHVRFNKGNYIWVAEFDMERGYIKPQTLTRCFVNTDAWETTPNFKSNPVMEGPTVAKIDDVYYLFYSANHFRNIDYAVGYATSKSPYGPWTKYENNPIIHRDIVGENGSGHGDLFQDEDGDYYYVYHVHYSDDVILPRRARIAPLKLKKGADGIYDIAVDSKNIIVPVQK